MENENRLSTQELLELLFKERSLESFLSRDESSFLMPSFSEYISRLCKMRGAVAEHIIMRADIEKSYGHQLFSGKRNPSRDTVIQMAFGFESDVDQAQMLLKVAQKTLLYPRVKRDSAIIYCLHNRISIVDTQIILHDLDLPLLGGRKNERD
ncbi:MAG: hypothetical protein GX975_06145 [Clostridiales bacterium]|nr:hypothetical protein [Clostridiales bacterium]